MPKDEFFIEKHKDGFSVLRPDAKRASAIETTQGKAIDRAYEINPDATIHVARVRHTSKGRPDQWRKE